MILSTSLFPGRIQRQKQCSRSPGSHLWAGSDFPPAPPFRSRSPVKQGRVQGINRVPVLMVCSFRHRNAEMNNTSRNPCAAVEQGNIRSAIARIASHLFTPTITALQVHLVFPRM